MNCAFPLTTYCSRWAPTKFSCCTQKHRILYLFLQQCCSTNLYSSISRITASFCTGFWCPVSVLGTCVIYASLNREYTFMTYTRMEAARSWNLSRVFGFYCFETIVLLFIIANGWGGGSLNEGSSIKYAKFSEKLTFLPPWYAHVCGPQECMTS